VLESPAVVTARWVLFTPAVLLLLLLVVVLLLLLLAVSI
jgi:hypothetical protein